MKRSRWAAGVFAALALAACGAAPPAVQTFLREHTQCAAAGYGDAQWSPDGASIYYSMFTPASVDLHVMSAVGKNDRQLAADATDPRLSPDGKMALFKRQVPGNAQAFDTYVMDLGTQKARRALANVLTAVWSPDSRWLLYPPQQTPGPLYKADAISGRTIQLTDTPPGGPEYDSSPLWSPDGKTIVFASTRASPTGVRTSVFVMDADGGHVRRLSSASNPMCPQQDVGDAPAAWLPDSQSLVYFRTCGFSATLHRVTLDGAEQGDLSWMGTDIFQIAWSPDGRQVLYTDSNPKTGGVHLANADGSDRLLLHAGASGGAWSPDGRLIAFTALDSAGLPEIYTIHPDGSGLTQLTDNPGSRVCLH